MSIFLLSNQKFERREIEEAFSSEVAICPHKQHHVLKQLRPCKHWEELERLWEKTASPPLHIPSTCSAKPSLCPAALCSLCQQGNILGFLSASHFWAEKK